MTILSLFWLDILCYGWTILLHHWIFGWFPWLWWLEVSREGRGHWLQHLVDFPLLACSSQESVFSRKQKGTNPMNGKWQTIVKVSSTEIFPDEENNWDIVLWRLCHFRGAPYIWTSDTPPTHTLCQTVWGCASGTPNATPHIFLCLCCVSSKAHIKVENHKCLSKLGWRLALGRGLGWPGHFSLSTSPTLTLCTASQAWSLYLTLCLSLTTI